MHDDAGRRHENSSVKASNSTAFTPIASQDGFRVIFQLETLRSWRGARKRGKSTQILALFAMEQASIVRIHSMKKAVGKSRAVSVILRPCSTYRYVLKGISPMTHVVQVFAHKGPVPRSWAAGTISDVVHKVPRFF